MIKIKKKIVNGQVIAVAVMNKKDSKAYDKASK